MPTYAPTPRFVKKICNFALHFALTLAKIGIKPSINGRVNSAEILGESNG